MIVCSVQCIEKEMYLSASFIEKYINLKQYVKVTIAIIPFAFEEEGM